MYESFLLATFLGIEPATFRFVSQYLNHCATAVHFWLQSYRIYHPEDWYVSAGEKPVREIMAYKRELVHGEVTVLGVHALEDRLCSWETCETCRKYYSIHLVVRLRTYPGESITIYILW